jgi:hypothetical protein
LASLEFSRGIPERLTLDEVAFKILESFFLEIDKNLGDGIVRESMCGFTGKLHGNAARIAGILHCLNYFEGDEQSEEMSTVISGQNMKKAVRITRFFMDHALIAYDTFGESANAQKVVFKKLCDTYEEGFSGNELFQEIKGSKFVKCADDLKSILDGLLKRNYLVLADLPKKKKSGRNPSPRYLINPLARELVEKQQA